MGMLYEYENSKESISEDLEQLAVLLNDYGLCKDTSSLYQASGLRYETVCENWKYYINIPITINTVPSHIRPIGIECLEISLSLQIEGSFLIEDLVENPLNDLVFDIVINGLSDNGEHIATWHLDKHVGKEGDGISKFIHPEYHFSFGGNKMWEQNLDYGNLLIHPSPRIPHPPMDAILGVDFILQNFIDIEVIQRLITTPEYRNILRNSQRRIWQPYMLAIARHWCEFNCSKFNGDKTLPFQYFPSLVN